MCKHEWQQYPGCLWLYYASNNHFPTRVAHLEVQSKVWLTSCHLHVAARLLPKPPTLQTQGQSPRRPPPLGPNTPDHQQQWQANIVQHNKWYKLCSPRLNLATAPYKHHCLVVLCASTNDNYTQGMQLTTSLAECPPELNGNVDAVDVNGMMIRAFGEPLFQCGGEDAVDFWYQHWRKVPYL